MDEIDEIGAHESNMLLGSLSRCAVKYHHSKQQQKYAKKQKIRKCAMIILGFGR